MADLINRDAALERIGTLRKAYLLHEPAGMGGMSAICTCRDIVNEIPAVNRWIPCAERMPEDEQEVLVFVKGDFENSISFITTAYNDSDGDWVSDYDGEVIDSKITHWMPLPEPPKEASEYDAE